MRQANATRERTLPALSSRGRSSLWPEGADRGSPEALVPSTRLGYWREGRARAFGGAAVKRYVGRVGRCSAIAGFAVVFGFPLYWTVAMAFKPGPEWNPLGGVIWWPRQPTLANFETVLGLSGPKDSPFLQQPSRSALHPIANSLVAAGCGTIVATIFGVLAAYGITRFRAGGRHLPLAILSIRFVPPIVFLIPLFVLFAYLGLWDTLPGLAILYAAFGFPLVVWLARSSLLELPRELSEAAIADGCTHWGAFLKVTLPQVKGAVAAAALFVFVISWSDLVIALVMTQDHAQTAPVFLASLESDEFQREFGPQAALSLILMGPPLALGLAMRRHLVRGLSLGTIRR